MFPGEHQCMGGVVQPCSTLESSFELAPHHGTRGLGRLAALSEPCLTGMINTTSTEDGSWCDDREYSSDVVFLAQFGSWHPYDESANRTANLAARLQANYLTSATFSSSKQSTL